MASLFEDAIDIPTWLAQDRAAPLRDRIHRDRTLGLAIGPGNRVARVRDWWRRLSVPERPSLGVRLRRARIALTLLVCGLSGAFGSGLATAALRYDGQYPVNVVPVFALLVGLPLALLLGSLLLIPSRLPLLGAVQDAVASINIGNLAAALIDRAGGATRDGPTLAWGAGRRGPLARMAKWQVLTLSQLAGLSFSLAATGTAFALVVVTDLAFGWSTTLDVTADQARTITNAIAWPWGSWLTQAVPSTDLVADSRFFRLSHASPPVPPGRLTGWWPFLLMSLLTYGALPRAALLVIAGFRLRAATRGALLDDAGVRALLDRMDSVSLDSIGEGRHEPTGAVPIGPAGRHRTFVRPGQVLAWDLGNDPGLIARWLAAHVDTATTPLLVGGDRLLREDAETLDALEIGATSLVLVLVKGWEPPLLDCIDFLVALRARIGPTPSILVVPLGLDGEAADDDATAAWVHAIARLGDPGTYVEPIDAGDEP